MQGYNCNVVVAQASEAAKILKFLSFRGTLRAEESLILLTLNPREIPHFVRNDKKKYFFRSLLKMCVGGAGDCGISPSSRGLAPKDRQVSGAHKFKISRSAKEQNTMQKITPFLWFDGKAEE